MSQPIVDHDHHDDDLQADSASRTHDRLAASRISAEVRTHPHVDTSSLVDTSSSRYVYMYMIPVLQLSILVKIQ